MRTLTLQSLKVFPSQWKKRFEGWKAAADSEYQSLIENKTWDLVELPSSRKPIGCKWVDANGCSRPNEDEMVKWNGSKLA